MQKEFTAKHKTEEERKENSRQQNTIPFQATSAIVSHTHTHTHTHTHSYASLTITKVSNHTHTQES